MKRKLSLVLSMCLLLMVLLPTTAMASEGPIFIGPSGGGEIVVYPGDSGDGWNLEGTKPGVFTINNLNCDWLAIQLDDFYGDIELHLADGSVNTVNRINVWGVSANRVLKVTGNGTLIVKSKNSEAAFSYDGNAPQIANNLSMTGGTKESDTTTLSFAGGKAVTSGGTAATYVKIAPNGSRDSSPTDTPQAKYTVTVNSGSGSGSYAANEKVKIVASIPEDGTKFFRFKEWTGTSGLTFESGSATTSTATFVMPARDVSITATYDEGFFSEPIYKAPSFGDYITATSALVHEYKYVEESSSPSDTFQTGRLIASANKELPDLGNFNVAQTVVDSNFNYLLQFHNAQEARDCSTYLKSLSSVKFVEPDSKYELYSVSRIIVNETLGAQLNTTSSNSWGVSATGADKYSEQLRASGIKSSVVVAVVDSGVDTSHPFLNGRVVPGYDIIDDDSVPQDANGHGTHVSGTIVDCTPGLSINILPVRVMGEDGRGNLSQICEGIEYAVDNGANVINLSIGGPGQSAALKKSVDYAVSHNVTVVVAAGNDNFDTSYYSPASYSNCITVSAVDNSLNKADFSNYGEAVDIAAPGVGVKSSVPGGKYEIYNGTSMAAPHVSAASALLLYGNTKQTPAQIEERLRSMATDYGSPGWDKYYGAGFLNLGSAGPVENNPNDNSGTVPTFSDVPKGAYYYDAVMWAVSEGITNGTTSTTFSPNDTCTTAQILTFMWRAGGSPEPTTRSNTGLSVQSPFYKALAWANEAGIRGSFSTNSASTPCTRAAAMEYMWNDAGKPSAGPCPFTDVSNKASYVTAVSWGVNQGITKGTTATTFSPNKACTRAHIITFLYRYYMQN